MIIYKIQNKINGKIYIGQTVKSVEHRLKTHLVANTYIGKALRKNGLNNFNISIIDLVYGKEDLNRKEKEWIKTCDCFAPNGYNLTVGGEGNSGWIVTEETRKKMSERQRGKNTGTANPFYGKHHTEETKKRLSEIRKNKSMSEEAKKNMSLAGQGRPSHRKGKSNIYSIETLDKMREAHLGEKNNFYGKHHSQETRQKMSHPKSEEGRKNILIAQRERRANNLVGNDRCTT